MDQALRTLEHAVRAAPEDAPLARRYRSALRRHGAHEPTVVAERLDRLQGVLALTRCGEVGPRDAPGPVAWRRLGLRGERPRLAPQLPAGDALAPAWSAPGQLRYLSAGVVLLQAPDQALEARGAASGRLLWRVAPELEVDPEHDTDSLREEALGWVVAPWGAARVAARFERDPQVRRVGRHTARGRITEREVVDHGEAAIELVLELLVDATGWREEPERLTYHAGAGEPLADTDMILEDFHDELLALSLDSRSHQLALRWRDAIQDWTLLSVTGGAGLSSAAGPAGWGSEAPDDPFDEPPTRQAPPPLPAELDDLPERELVPVDGGWLVVGRGARGHELHELRADGARRRFAGWALEDALEGRSLRTRGPGRDKDASLLVADGRLWLQTDVLSVWASA